MQYFVSSCVLFGIELLFALAMSSSDFGAAKWCFGLSLDGRSWSGGESNLGRFTPCENS